MDNEKISALVIKAQKGESQALNDLFAETYNNVYYFALKTVKNEALASDVTQETFITIFNNINKLKDAVAYSAWSRQITYRQCLKHIKKQGKEVVVEENEDGTNIFDNVTEERDEFIPGEEIDKDDFKQTIMSIVDNLPEEQRTAVILYYFDELSVKQIAEIQEVSEGTVKSRLNYARKAIKASVEEYERKNNIKLHAISFFPLLNWIFKNSVISMPGASAKIIAEGVAAATGTTVAATVTTTTATGTTTAAATTATKIGIGAKIAAMPLTTKIIAGAVAVTISVGGITAAVLPKSEKTIEIISKEQVKPIETILDRREESLYNKKNFMVSCMFSNIEEMPYFSNSNEISDAEMLWYALSSIITQGSASKYQDVENDIEVFNIPVSVIEKRVYTLFNRTCDFTKIVKETNYHWEATYIGESTCIQMKKKKREIGVDPEKEMRFRALEETADGDTCVVSGRWYEVEYSKPDTGTWVYDELNDAYLIPESDCEVILKKVEDEVTYEGHYYVDRYWYVVSYQPK